LRIDNLFWGNPLPPPSSGEGRLPPLSSAAYFDELLFTKLFRGCEYLFRTQPDSSSISARNRYSHRAGILIHITPERLFTCPGIRTLGYANRHRPAKLYEELFYTVLGRFREEKGLGLRKQRFRFKNKLLSLDSTTISLCLEMFPWAKFRRAKGGVKAHVLLDHDDYLPRYVLVTEGRSSDVKMADAFPLNPGSIVAMDRGYNDYALFGRWTAQEIYFVTRLKDNAAYQVINQCAVPANRNIRSDQLIRFTGEKAQKDCPCLLRRVEVWDAANEREIVLLTNLLAFGSTTIAAIYKDRWEIELFFKALKQNLKVKSFVGTSENALRIQIWTALIAILLLKWLHHLSKAKWSLSNLAAMLRLNLFTYRDLTAWLDNPFGTPPILPQSQQLTLALA